MVAAASPNWRASVATHPMLCLAMLLGKAMWMTKNRLGCDPLVSEDLLKMKGVIDEKDWRVG